MQYDEIRITTRREIHICEAAIKKLEHRIAAMEAKYRRKIADLQREDFDTIDGATHGELKRWRDDCLALQRWNVRLDEHRRIMAL